MKAKYLTLFLCFLSLIIFNSACDDAKTNDQIFKMENIYYMLEKGVTKEIYLSEHNQDGYNTKEESGFDQVMNYTLDRNRSVLELTPKAVGEAKLTVQVLGPDSVNHYFLTFNVFPENKLILYPYSHNSLNKTVSIPNNGESVQFFINGEEEFTTTSGDEEVAVAEIQAQSPVEPQKMAQLDITPPEQILPKSEINPNYFLVIKAISPGETSILISDKNGKNETIKVKVLGE